MAINKKIVLIFDKFALRDNSLHLPDDLCWLETENKKRVGFAVDNGTDATITVQPIGIIGSVKANLGSSVNVSAKSSEIVSLNLNDHFALAVSVSIHAITSPTDGRITVFGAWQDA